MTVLPGPEAAGHGHRPAFGHREEEVEDALPGDERAVVRQARSGGARGAHAPAHARGRGVPSSSRPIGVVDGEVSGRRARPPCPRPPAAPGCGEGSPAAPPPCPARRRPTPPLRLRASGSKRQRRAGSRVGTLAPGPDEVAGALRQHVERAPQPVEDGAEQARARAATASVRPVKASGSPTARPLVSSYTCSVAVVARRAGSPRRAAGPWPTAASS